MAITIESLYQDYRSNYQDKSEYFIDFYTSNALFFNNIPAFKDVEALRMYMQITCRYVNALCNKGRYNECIETCDKNLGVIDNEILRLNAEEVKNDWYFTILFAKGVSCYYLNDYKTSKSIFKTLISYDSKNELYQKWLKYAKHNQRGRYAIVGAVTGAIIMVTSIIFKNEIPYLYRQSINITLFILAIAAGTYDFYIRRSMRRSKN